MPEGHIKTQGAGWVCEGRENRSWGRLLTVRGQRGARRGWQEPASLEATGLEMVGIASPPDLRILTVMNCSGSSPSGMPTGNASLGRALRALGCVVDNLYLEDCPAYVRRRWLNYPLFGVASWARVRQLEAERGSYDVIQISGGDGYIAPLLRRDRAGRRRLIVARSHGLEHRYWEAFGLAISAGLTTTTLRHRAYFGLLRLRQVELAVRAADLLNCYTAEDAEYVTARGWKRPSQVVILPSGIEPAWLNRSPDPTTSTRRILFCGSWTWVKGVGVLIPVFERLAAADPEVTLTAAGTGVVPTAVRAMFSPAVRDRVTVLPDASHEEILATMRRHDLLLATSLFEGFGTVVIEAMAVGLPVVAAAVGGAPDYVVTGQSGYLVSPGDVDGFVGACRSLLSSSASERRELATAAAEAVSVLTWPVVASGTLAAYADALRKVQG